MKTNFLKPFNILIIWMIYILVFSCGIPNLNKVDNGGITITASLASAGESDDNNTEDAAEISRSASASVYAAGVFLLIPSDTKHSELTVKGLSQLASDTSMIDIAQKKVSITIPYDQSKKGIYFLYDKAVNKDNFVNEEPAFAGLTGNILISKAQTDPVSIKLSTIASDNLSSKNDPVDFRNITINYKNRAVAGYKFIKLKNNSNNVEKFPFYSSGQLEDKVTIGLQIKLNKEPSYPVRLLIQSKYHWKEFAAGKIINEQSQSKDTAYIIDKANWQGPKANSTTSSSLEVVMDTPQKSNVSNMYIDSQFELKFTAFKLLRVFKPETPLAINTGIYSNLYYQVSGYKLMGINGPILQEKAGLMWQPEDNVYRGSSGDRSQEEAIKLCKLLNTDEYKDKNYGFTDWSLPSSEQLKGLGDSTAASAAPYVNPILGFSGSNYWSSTVKKTKAEYVEFSNPAKIKTLSLNTKNNFKVRCVRKSS